ncbi:50S ribosomal protein L18 [Candidatus Nomurabacteria bacterium]|nr:50S ribosomal protein L18 [Candidatus Kaiserbacteria bacterium]MCB9814675.1 50S ribosomal protein L18 [Candidatus Nomurabacteria bacterium]
MEKSQYKSQMRTQRHKRLRSKVSGTAARPRLAVFRSNTAVYAQLIDDEAGKTLGAADSRKEAKGTLVEKSKLVGANIAKMAVEAKITEVVFDRGGFRYQGTIAALADAAREGGLKF